ncbi:MAG: hypothetical protein NZ730_06690 [Porticoccaceae bacterium]|nr:hypothetical protein [Porticoccaceae bacterium]
MAFSRDGLNKIGGGTGSGRALYVYASTDAKATTSVSGYFNDAADELVIGDVILLIDTDTHSASSQLFTYVKSNTGTVVDVGAGVAVSGG